MNKLELVTKALVADIKGNADEEQRTAMISDAIKSFACDALTRFAFLKEKGISPEIIKEFMEQDGIKLDLRTNKFS